jgi:3-oxoacyl-[acyl-carrier-protein] synthase II
MQRRVVITGLGVVSPIGIGVAHFWRAALEGRSGITALRPLADFPLESYRCQIAGQVRDFQASQFLEAGIAERVDRYAQFAMIASREAIRDAALTMEHEAPHRVGVIVGAGMGGMVMGEREITKLYRSQRPERVHPNFIPTITLNSASGLLAIQHGAKGPNLTISTACSSGAHAIGQSLSTIRAGKADVMMAVGADASLTPLVFAGFCTLRALSTKFNKTPHLASRPFDRLRDGFVMGEGAGALILESLSHAKRRRAKIYAEIAGYGATSESFHVVIPREDGADMATTMALALEDAEVSPAQVDYINAHATSTMVGDAAEVRGIRRLLKSRADHVVVNATKSLIGHTLGAAGAIGAIASILALQNSMIHPTINYEQPDADCALPGISAKVQERRVKVALLNAFGFGSNNAALVFKKWH